MVAVIRDNQDPRQAEEFLDELEFLAETADIVSVKRFTQRLPQPSARIYVGPGKLEEIAGYCREQQIDVVIFDDELSPSQTRNIEKAMPCRILDRTRLILDIFMSRAQTAYAKTQVQLANYEYMLPRLSGMWTHLERQRGGTGTRGGAGEREIETDRRIIRNADEGYLIGRIFINRERRYFVEGKQQTSMRAMNFGKAEIDREALIGILEPAIWFALNFDLLMPPYEDNKRVTVDQFNTKMDNSKFVTGKRLGYDFEVEDI